ncbi:TolC family protein [candidate division WOR-3 bacterium]|nr:TolC family protein [candidate division WOR-3 bacterium]
MILFLLLIQVDSLSVEQALDRAFKNSPVIGESRASMDRSRIQFYQILAELLPTAYVTARYTKSEYQGYATSGYDGSLQLTMPLLDLDIISSIFASGRQLKGSAIQHEADVSNLCLRTKTAYYNLVNALELLRSSELTIERARHNLDLVEARYELGAASRLELLQGEVFYLNAQHDRSRARTTEVSAQEELKSILDITDDIYPTEELTAPEAVEMPDLDSLTAILHQLNYGIRIAAELSNASRINLISSYLAFLPRLSLFYGYNVSSDSLIFDFQHYQDSAVKNYGVSVTFPVFEIKSLVFRYLNAKNEMRRSEFARQRVELETRNILRTTYYSLREALDRLQLASRSLDAAEEAAVIAREQYALGSISFLDFLSAEQSIYDARVSYTSALRDYYVQRAAFSYILGNSMSGKEW